MAEPQLFAFTHKELAEILVKHQDIHEGIWGIFMRFGIKGMNVGTSESDLTPAAIVPIVEVGLQRFETENNLSVDASKVNRKLGAPRKRGSKR